MLRDCKYPSLLSKIISITLSILLIYQQISVASIPSDSLRPPAQANRDRASAILSDLKSASAGNPALEAILRRYSDIVDSKISSDGETAVTMHADRKARMWDLQTGSCLREFRSFGVESAIKRFNALTHMEQFKKSTIPVINPSLTTLIRLLKEGKRDEFIKMARLAKKAGARSFHIDIFDDNYVDTAGDGSNMDIFTPEVVELLLELGLPIDAHFMVRPSTKGGVEKFKEYIGRFIDKGAGFVSIHWGAFKKDGLSDDDIRDVLEFIKARGACAGLVINPDEDAKNLLVFKDDIDFALIMSVIPGAGGRGYDKRALDNLKVLQDAQFGKLVAVDGAISDATISKIIRRGGKWLVVGSYYFGDMKKGLKSEEGIRQAQNSLIDASRAAKGRLQIIFESGLGNGVGVTDGEYLAVGKKHRDGSVVMADTAKEVWQRAHIIIKVKEPLREGGVDEFELMKGMREHTEGDTLVIGVVKEIKKNEGRAALLPDGIDELLAFAEENGCHVGDLNRALFTYYHFAASKSLTEATLATGTNAVALEAIVGKAKDAPLFQNPDWINSETGVPGRIVVPQIVKNLKERLGDTLVCLDPMSIVAGMEAPLQGVVYSDEEHVRYLSDGLYVSFGWTDLILDLYPDFDVQRLREQTVLITGAGTAGLSALWQARRLGAKVIISDVEKNLDILRDILGEEYGQDFVAVAGSQDNLTGLLDAHNIVIINAADKHQIKEAFKASSVTIGAALNPKGKAPITITADMIKEVEVYDNEPRVLQKRRVIVDIAIDQGGNIEYVDREGKAMDIGATYHSDPVRPGYGRAIYYRVGNMPGRPGVIARASSRMLQQARMPYLKQLMQFGFVSAAKRDPGFRQGISAVRGELTDRVVAATKDFNMQAVEIDDALRRYPAKRACVYGFGAIGRAFFAQLFRRSGYSISAVDIDKDVLSAIGHNARYTIYTKGKGAQETVIDNVSAVDGKDEAKVIETIVDADIMGLCLRPQDIVKAAPSIARALLERYKQGRPPLNIIISLNMKNQAGFVWAEIEKHIKAIDASIVEAVRQNTGLIDTTVGKMTRLPTPAEKQTLGAAAVITENFNRLPVMLDPKGNMNYQLYDIVDAQPKENLSAEEELKLYLHNCAYAICAYEGYRRGHHYVHEAIRDAEIKDEVYHILHDEVAPALIAKWKLDAQEVHRYCDELIERFDNEALTDPLVERIGANIIRKLGPEERLIGAAKAAFAYRKQIPVRLCNVISYALTWDHPVEADGKDLQQRLREEGVDGVLRSVCGLGDEHKPLMDTIARFYRLLFWSVQPLPQTERGPGGPSAAAIKLISQAA